MTRPKIEKDFYLSFSLSPNKIEFYLLILLSQILKCLKCLAVCLNKMRRSKEGDLRFFAHFSSFTRVPAKQNKKKSAILLHFQPLNFSPLYNTAIYNMQGNTKLGKKKLGDGQEGGRTSNYWWWVGYFGYCSKPNPCLNWVECNMCRNFCMFTQISFGFVSDPPLGWILSVA